VKLPICAAITRDGTRCGRRAAPEGLLCHIHRAAAEGKAVGPLVEPSPFDPEATLRKIAANPKHQHQVQALRLLLDRQGCPTCAARAAAEDPDERIDIWGDVTVQERARMSVLFAEFQQVHGEIQQIKATVIARIKGNRK
jgi:hypothetical protein